MWRAVVYGIDSLKWWICSRGCVAFWKCFINDSLSYIYVRVASLLWCVPAVCGDFSFLVLYSARCFRVASEPKSRFEDSFNAMNAILVS